MGVEVSPMRRCWRRWGSILRMKSELISRSISNLLTYIEMSLKFGNLPWGLQLREIIEVIISI